MFTPSSFLANDRRSALAHGETLPEQMFGSLLFADIAGFTPLTAAMVEVYGERDAVDKLTMQINHVFAQLIEEVDRFGGCVVGFGGDALTCWFREDDGLQAVSCAQKMQEWMKGFETVKIAEQESKALTLKIGITVGIVRRFQVGDPEIQLLDVMAGSAVNELRIVLHSIRAGEIRVGARVLERLGRKLIVVEGNLDEQDGQPVAVIQGVQTDVLIPRVHSISSSHPSDNSSNIENQLFEPWLLKSVYERICTGEGQFLNDIRPVVVLFLKFEGLDYQQNDAGTKLNDYVRWVQQTMSHYHGFLIKLTVDDKGSYILATFGAPEADEADAEHAALAALELRLSPEKFAFITGVQIGIHRGRRILCGAFGSATCAAYDLLGNAANLANRLMTTARHNQILVSKRIVESTVNNFAYSLPILKDLKGAKESMYLYTLVDRLPESHSLLTFDVQMVGRERELAQLSLLLDKVFAEQGQVLLIEGEAGIGKSQLVAAMIEHAQRLGCRVAVGACDRVHQAVGYSPWRQIIRALLDIPQTDSSFANNLILYEFIAGRGVDGSSTESKTIKGKQEQLFAHLNDLLLSHAQTLPLVLIIEDLHWIDGASLTFLNIFSHLLLQAPILVILTLRNDEMPHELMAELERNAFLTRLALEGLSSQMIQIVVQRVLRYSVDPLLLGVIEARCQGNPFYAEELALAMREAESITYRDSTEDWILSAQLQTQLQGANCMVKDGNSGEWILSPDTSLSAVDLGVPETLHQLTLSRIDRLPESCRQTIHVASIIGTSFSEDLLVQSHPGKLSSDEIANHLNLLQANQLITPSPTGAYHFRHHITQEVTYESMVQTVRQTLHYVVGSAIEGHSPDSVELLAYHFTRTTDRAKSLHYLSAAAKKTQRSFALQAALNYYNQALAIESRAEWLQGKVEVAHILGLRPIEKEILHQLETRKEVSQFSIAYLWAQYYEATSQYDRVEQEVGRALQEIQIHTDPLAEARCWALLGLTARRVGQYAQCNELSQKALDLLENCSATVEEKSTIQIALYNNLAFVSRQQMKFAETAACSEHSLTLCRSIGNHKGEAEALTSLAAVAYYRRDLETYLRLVQQAIQIQRLIGDLAGEGTSLYNRALSLYEYAHFEDAMNDCESALHIHRMTLNRYEEGNVRTLLGYLYYLCGDFDRAGMELQTALDTAHDIGDKSLELYVLGNLGLILRDHDRLQEAADALKKCYTIAQEQNEQQNTAMAMSHLAIVYLRSGELAKAVKCAKFARKTRWGFDAIALTTIDLTTLAQASWLLGKKRTALAYVEQALSLLEQSTDQKPEFPQRDYYLCHQILQQAGRHEEASQALQTAYSIVMQQAQGFRDDTRRQRFLTRVPHNREIVETYRAR